MSSGQLVGERHVQMTIGVQAMSFGQELGDGDVLERSRGQNGGVWVTTVVMCDIPTCCRVQLLAICIWSSGNFRFSPPACEH